LPKLTAQGLEANLPHARERVLSRVSP